jgi:DNA topoisomerase-1
VDVRDRRLARVVKRCKALPGQHLFQYVDEDGEPRVVESGDVNDYLREISGDDFTAKDFRTWAGTVLAGWALQEIGGWDSETQAKSNVVRAIETVSKKLGNTPAICRKSYVHPAVIDAYVDGSMVRTLARRARKEIGSSLSGLSAEEAAILALLESRLRSEAARTSRSA